MEAIKWRRLTAVVSTAASLSNSTGAAAAGSSIRGTLFSPGRLLQTAATDSKDLGCYVDSQSARRFEAGIKGSPDNHRQFCFDFCNTKGLYQYFGLQYGSECWCGVPGADYAGLGSLPQSSCTKSCTGSSTEYCGGSNALQVFEYTTGGPEPPSDDGLCYADDQDARILPQAKKGIDDLTIASCKFICQADPTNVFYGLQYSTECWCGPGTSDFSQHGLSTACTMLCSGDADEICGGGNAMNVYRIGNNKSFPPTPGPTPTSSPTPTPGPLHTPHPGGGDCYADALNDRILPQSAKGIPDMTPESCKALCEADATHTYYGVQYGNECWCGPASSDIDKHGPSTACNKVCSGDANLICGGGNAMNIYRIGGPDDLPSSPTPASLRGTTVLVDLVPCILTPEAITETTAGPYMMEIFYKGYWSGPPVIIVASPGDDLLTEMTINPTHGKCNTVYVGLPATDVQFTALSEYSSTFKARIVYFDVSETSAHPDFTAKLGIQANWQGDLLSPSAIRLTAEGAAGARIVNSGLQTDPGKNNLFTRPIRITGATASTTPIAEYLDESGTSITSDGFPGVAMMEYRDAATGLEELHVFFSIGWFDLGSWAWVHHIAEWATKGIFMGERRFYLGATVDDMFLATNEFKYDGLFNQGTAHRSSAEDYEKMISVQNDLNSKYSSEIITEYVFNGAGILQEVGSPYVPPYENTIVTVKGTKMTPPGLQSIVIPPDYLSVTVPLMEAEAAAGGWDSDALLQAVLAYPNDGFHGSHTLTHLSRDELQASDCNAEDGANVRIAVYSGMFDMDTYNWRSMVSPGITGLFNANCLRSGEANLMTCYPGDNTYDGIQTTVSLVNKNSQFHSIYSTVATNGHAGIQIVPRYATYVYYNCVSGKCLVDENEYIRRIVCGCSELDPTIPNRGTCSNVGSVYGCNSNDDIASFGSTDAIYKAEAETTTRHMLMGRRDKYMFHQANIIPTADLGGMSSLEKWYVDVMATLSNFVTFPVKSVKFDDLCVNFQEHEALDADSPIVTATKDAATGAILGMTLDSTGGAGVIPVTVPTVDAASVFLGSLAPYKTETYGSDTTYYFTTGEPPSPAPKPSVSDLPPLTAAAAGDAVPIPVEEQEKSAMESIEAEQENAAVAGEQGFVAPDQPLLGPKAIELLKERTLDRIIENSTDRLG